MEILSIKATNKSNVENMAFLCGFQNFVITFIQQYFWRFVVNKISFTLKEQYSKTYMNRIWNYKIEELLLPLFSCIHFIIGNIKTRLNPVFFYILCTRTTTKPLLDSLKLFF